jgi:hypothetical protein
MSLSRKLELGVLKNDGMRRFAAFSAPRAPIRGAACAARSIGRCKGSFPMDPERT